LLVSLALSAGLAAFGKFAGGLLPMPEAGVSAINFLVSLVAIAIATSFLFGLIFKYIPETEISW